MIFEFNTDEEAYEFCQEIVRMMMNDFGITEEESLIRLNKHWRGLGFEDLDIRYHEDPTYWAYQIYYPDNSFWWNREGDPTLRPRPLPQVKKTKDRKNG